jgi:hypothetical protein
MKVEAHFGQSYSHECAAMFVGNLTLVGVLGLKQNPAQAALAAPLPLITLIFWYWMTRIKFKGECEFLSIADARLVDERKGQITNAQVGKGALLGQSISIPQSVPNSTKSGVESTQIQLVDNSILPRVTDTAQGSRRVSKAENIVDNMNQQESELQSLKQENTMLTGKGHALLKHSLIHMDNLSCLQNVTLHHQQVQQCVVDRRNQNKWSEQLNYIVARC